MIIRELSDFNLRQIAQSGQCFRMNEIVGAEAGALAASLRRPLGELVLERVDLVPERMEPASEQPENDFMVYRVVSASHIVTIAQQGKTVIFFCGDQEFPYWENYFDLQADYNGYMESIDSEDTYLRSAASYGGGIRILRQDIWEMIITFVISQQKTIPNIKALVEALSRRYGTPVKCREEDAGMDERAAGEWHVMPNMIRYAMTDTALYSFPTPEQLSQATLEDLLDLKLGYRAKYIRKICEDVCAGALDLDVLRTLDYTSAMAYLQQFYGIGEKVANCVCLFGLHHIDAFPVDTWIRKILINEYLPKSQTAVNAPRTKQCSALVEEFFSCYAGYAGVMQQYIFYYERMKNTK